MSGIFQHQERDAKKLDYILTKKVDNSKNSLIIGVIGRVRNINIGEIYIWKPGIQRPKKVKQRENIIWSFSLLEDTILDGGLYAKIKDTINDKTYATTDRSIFAIESYKEDVYHSVFNRIYKDKREFKKREGWVYALYRFDDRLVDGGHYNYIYDTITNEVLAERKGEVRSISSLDNTLMDADRSTVRNTITGEIITRRDARITTLCAYRGGMLDAGDYGAVYNTLTDEKLFDFPTGITAMKAIPSSIADILIQKNEKII